MGARGPLPMSAQERELRGDAGKRAPRRVLADKGDTSSMVPAAAIAGGTPPQAGGTRPVTPARGTRPAPPEWLSEAGRGEWEEVVPLLEGLGFLDAADVGMLALYCETYAHWKALNEQLHTTETHVVHCRECYAVVETSSYLVSGARGNLVKTPVWQMWQQAGASLERLSKVLGLTPEARMRRPAAPPADEGKSDPLGQWASGEGDGDGDDSGAAAA